MPAGTFFRTAGDGLTFRIGEVDCTVEARIKAKTTFMHQSVMSAAPRRKWSGNAFDIIVGATALRVAIHSNIDIAKRYLLSG